MFCVVYPITPPSPSPRPPPSQCHLTCHDYIWNVENGNLSKYVNVSWDLTAPDLRWKQTYSSPILASLRIHTPPFFTVIGRYHARSNVLDLLFLCLLNRWRTTVLPYNNCPITNSDCSCMVMENIRLLLLLLLLLFYPSYHPRIMHKIVYITRKLFILCRE